MIKKLIKNFQPKVDPPLAEKLKIKNYNKGFTLIETLVTIAVFTLVIGAVSTLIIMIYKSQRYNWEQASAVNEARKGIETMTREIREAREASDGSYAIEKADDKEFIFYSDIDNDGKTERVRYFLGTVNSGTQTQECQTSVSGGTCSVLFSNFFTGTLKSAQVKVSVDGDMSWDNREYAEVFADTVKLGEVCRTDCSDCLGSWQGTQTYDVTSYASDNSITFLADATSYVNTQCSPGPYTMKAKFEFSFSEELAGFAHEFRKGVIKPVGDPPTYPANQEIVTVLTPYVRNVPPIFEYYDANSNKITEYPARLTDTKMMKVFLVVNIDPNRPPSNFELESFVQLRNLKTE